MPNRPIEFHDSVLNSITSTADGDVIVHVWRAIMWDGEIHLDGNFFSCYPSRSIAAATFNLTWSVPR